MKKLEVKKVCQDDAQTIVLHKKLFDQFKVSTVAATITSMICASVPTYAADLEIYKVPEDSTGATTLMMMLDLSGSMKEEMGNGNSASRISTLKKGLTDVLSGTATAPRVDDKIVMGLATFTTRKGQIRIPAKALGTKTGNEVLEGTYKKPIWTRYSQTGASCGRRCTPPTTVYYNKCIDWDINNYNCLKWSGDTTSSTGYTEASPLLYTTDRDCTYGNRDNCRFVYEEIKKYRDETHRDTLLTAIKGMSADGNTPTPYAYADAGAYMMGTTTEVPPLLVNIPAFAKYNSSSGWECRSWNIDNASCSDWGSYKNSGYSVPSGFTTSKSCKVSRYDATCYYYDKTFTNPDLDNSGFSASDNSAKNGSIYKAPDSILDQLPDTAAAKAKKECSGQGIYFLTDGEPNPTGGTTTGADGI